MTKLLRITTAIMCVLMFTIVVGQVYMLEGMQQGRQEFAQQVIDLNLQLTEIKRRLSEEEETRLDYLVYRITTCESGRRHNGIWGDNGMAYGIAQFWEATFYSMAKQAGLKNPNWH